MSSFAHSAADLFSRLDRELWLVTAADGERRGGLIATFVCQASIVPEMPRVLVGLARSHHTWELVDASRAFALHLLGEANLDWVWRFGLQSGRTVDKFAGLDVRNGTSGSPILAGGLGWLDCQVESRLETGDRTVFLAEVVAAEGAAPGTPLTFKHALQRATPEQLKVLKAQLDGDAAVDAGAVQAWRRRAW